MSDADTPPTASTVVDICNSRGLHARASAKFVKLASEYEADIRVTRDGVTVNALSIRLHSPSSPLKGRMPRRRSPPCAIWWPVALTRINRHQAYLPTISPSSLTKRDGG